MTDLSIDTYLDSHGLFRVQIYFKRNKQKFLATICLYPNYIPWSLMSLCQAISIMNDHTFLIFLHYNNPLYSPTP